MFKMQMLKIWPLPQHGGSLIDVGLQKPLEPLAHVSSHACLPTWCLVCCCLWEGGRWEGAKTLPHVGAAACHRVTGGDFLQRLAARQFVSRL